MKLVMPRTIQRQAFTLIEVLVVFAIMAIVALIATPYLSGTQEKSMLMLERDRLVSTLELAQQKSIAAEEGQEFSVVIMPATNQYVLNPDGKVTNLPEDIEITEPMTETNIAFSKLFGKPDAQYNIQLASKHFTTILQLGDNGSVIPGDINRR